MSNRRVTSVGTEVASLLATKLRVITSHQIAAAYFAERKDPRECAGRLARKLEAVGLAKAWRAVITHVDTPMPLLAWRPIDEQPDIPAIAWANQKRWQSATPTRTVCLTSTERAKAMFGGSCREPRHRELEHDVAVTSVYLRLALQEPEVLAAWQHEDGLLKSCDKRPDAVLARMGQKTFIDILGRGYTRDKISQIWAAYQASSLELW